MTKEGNMKFNYNTLDVTLHKETRSLTVALNRPEKNNAINIEMLFELEGLFSWLTSHLEVNAIVLTGSGDQFCSGFDSDELKIMSEEKLQKYMARFQKVVAGMLHLPQTIICDLKNGAAGMGIELALGADIRVSRSTSTLHFNQLDKGWVPCAGGVGLLNVWVGQSTARHWTMTSAKVNGQDQRERGFTMETYSEGENCTEKILKNIFAQAPVARIQAKRSFLESILPELQRTFEYESVFSFASMKTQDWKKDSDEPFTAARDLAREIQQQ